MEVSTRERTLTELDHVRLSKLLRRDRHGGRPSTPPPLVEQLLDHFAIVTPQQVGPDVVTMGSQVLLQDAASGECSRLTLCYPADAAPALGRISVLSPVGSSLLGRPVGSVARWRTPAGEERAAEILALLFQPEASGDYAT